MQLVAGLLNMLRKIIYTKVAGPQEFFRELSQKMKGKARPRNNIKADESLFDDSEPDLLGTVLMKSGETVQVKLKDFKKFLEENEDRIVFQHDPDMPPLEEF